MPKNVDTQLTVEQELLKATKLEARKKGEPDQKYFARLARAMNALEESSWKKLTEGAQEWVNAVVKSINTKSELPAFPDAVNGSKEIDEAPKSKRASKKEDEEEVPPKKAAVAASKGEPRKRGGSAFYRRLMILNPDWDKARLIDEMEQNGFHLSAGTLEITYYETKSTLAVLKEEGMLKVKRQPEAAAV